MFPFDSLSESGALVAQQGAEIALIVASGFVVAGLLGELESVKRRFKRFGVIATPLVAIGVSGELIADGALFGASDRFETLSGMRILIAGITANSAMIGERSLEDANQRLKDTIDKQGRTIKDADAQIVDLTRKETALRDVLASDEKLLAYRVVTKRQYEAISSLIGKIPAVNFASEQGCLECEAYASWLAGPLVRHQDKISVHEYFVPSLAMQGIMEISKNQNDPVYLALARAGLHPGWLNSSSYAADPRFPLDVPLIFVGERYGLYKFRLYIPPVAKTGAARK